MKRPIILAATAATVATLGMLSNGEIAFADECIVSAGVTQGVGSDGFPFVNGTAGDDIIDCSRSVGHVITGLDGDDNIKGGNGINVIFGGGGNDIINGGDDDDFISGADGDDDIFGAGGDDDIFSGNGDDFLTGGTGDDNINGGGGNDFVLYFDATGGVTVNLAEGIAEGNSTDTLSDIEGIFGSDFSDTLIGDAGPNAIFGGDGNDIISGGAGDDSLEGDDGDDFLDGGEGVDALDGGDGTDICIDGEDITNCEPTAVPRLWTDVDCDGDTDAVDALKLLRQVAGLSVTQTPPCLAIGGTVQIDGVMRLWGDADCDGDVDSIDALKKLRTVAGLPVTQDEPCPDIGSNVLITDS